jgi:hypothetical protein
MVTFFFIFLLLLLLFCCFIKIRRRDISVAEVCKFLMKIINTISRTTDQITSSPLPSQESAQKYRYTLMAVRIRDPRLGLCTRQYLMAISAYIFTKNNIYMGWQMSMKDWRQISFSLKAVMYFILLSEQSIFFQSAVTHTAIKMRVSPLSSYLMTHMPEYLDALRLGSLKNSNSSDSVEGYCMFLWIIHLLAFKNEKCEI